MDLHYLLLGLMVVSVVLLYGNNRWDSPLVTIINRWLRWIIFSMAAAYIIQELELIDRPYPILVALSFMGWFLVESIMTWMGIRALSYSNVSLFPAFKDNLRGEEWPAQKQFIDLKNWLRAQKFHSEKALKADILGSIVVPASIYQDESNTIRLQIMFFPMRNRGIRAYYSLSSKTSDGTLFVTENLHAPFGGFYPDEWFYKRKLFTKSIQKLFEYHKDRMDASACTFVEWSSDPLMDIHSQQRKLQEVNTELGFLVPLEHQHFHGQISLEGRYRIWREALVMKYFGL